MNDAADRVAAGGPCSKDAARVAASRGSEVEARAAAPRGSAADAAAIEALRRGDEDLLIELLDAHMKDAVHRLAPQAGEPAADVQPA